MNFKEKQLVEILAKALKKQFGTNVAFQELSAGYGIADLVFAEDFSFTKRSISRPPITSYTALQIFLGMPQDAPCSLEQLSKLMPGSAKNEVKKYLALLERNGYVSRDGQLYQRIIDDTLFNPIKKVIAIEVKLSDHKSGLIQARRYQYFADESYLAILKGTIKEKHIEEFKQYNIGLILFDKETGSIEIHHPASLSERYSNDLNLFAKEIMLDSFSKSASLARL